MVVGSSRQAKSGERASGDASATAGMQGRDQRAGGQGALDLTGGGRSFSPISADAGTGGCGALGGSESCQNGDEGVGETCSGDSAEHVPPGRLIPIKLTKVAVFLVAVLAGLISNSAFDVLTRVDPGCGHVVTSAQYLFAVVSNAPEGFRWGAARRIPALWHAAAVACLFLTSHLGNLSLEFSLPLPLYFLLKCGNLLATMLVGRVLLRKVYPPRQYVSVCVITLGLCIATYYAKVKQLLEAHVLGPSTFTQHLTLDLFAGIFILFTSLCFGSGLGAVQEMTFARFGKHIPESLFHVHLIALPLYMAINRASIAHHGMLWCSGAVGSWPVFGVPVPKVWAPLVVNMICNNACRNALCALTASSSSLSSMFATTGFRFLTILVSALMLSPPPYPPAVMWLGVLLVLIGSVSSLLASNHTCNSEDSVTSGKLGATHSKEE